MSSNAGRALRLDAIAVTVAADPKRTPGAAWDAVYRLRAQAPVVHTEPLWTYHVADVHARPATRASGGGGDDPGTATDFEWSLKNTRVIAAWARFGSRKPGAGVVVGHPDTGFTPPFLHLTPGASRTRVERQLSRLLGVSDRALPKALQDVGDELLFQFVMYPPLRDALIGPGRARTTRARSRSPVARTQASTRLRAWLQPDTAIRKRR